MINVPACFRTLSWFWNLVRHHFSSCHVNTCKQTMNCAERSLRLLKRLRSESSFQLSSWKHHACLAAGSSVLHLQHCQTANCMHADDTTGSSSYTYLHVKRDSGVCHPPAEALQIHANGCCMSRLLRQSIQDVYRLLPRTGATGLIHTVELLRGQSA